MLRNIFISINSGIGRFFKVLFNYSCFSSDLKLQQSVSPIEHVHATVSEVVKEHSDVNIQEVQVDPTNF